MNHWRKLWILGLVLLLASLPIACSQEAETPGDTETPGEKVRVAEFLQVRANEYYQAYVDGVTDRIEEDNLNVEVQYFSCEFDPIEQNNQIQDAIASGNYDVLVIHAQDHNAVVPAIQDALDAGLIVIASGGPIGPDLRSLDPYPEGVACVVASTGWSQGLGIGQSIVEASEGMEKAKVAYLVGSQALSLDQERYAAIQEVLKDHPNIEIVAYQEGQFRRDKAREVMQDVFEAHPDINIVASSGDQMTLGAEDAARDAGLEDLKLIGFGCSKQGWQALKEGRWFSSYANIPYTNGKIVIDLAVKAAKGEQIPTSVSLDEQQPPLPPEGALITQDNVDLFEAEW